MVVSPVVTLKHGSGMVKPTSGIVKPKQEVQKKEEEVKKLFDEREKYFLAQDYEYLTRNVFPGNIRPEDLGTGNDEEAAGVWCKVVSIFNLLQPSNLPFSSVPPSG